MTNEKWHNERRKGIGGSDIAAIMGLSPWRTPYQVYQEKRGDAEGFTGNEATDWGIRLEPTIRQWYSDVTGRPVFRPEGILRHKQYDYMLANLDGYTEDRRVVEIKTARYGKGWGEPGTDAIPDYYALQVHHYMTITGYEVADVAVSIGGAPPCLYEVEADKEIAEAIIDACATFWARVVEGRPPEPVNYADAVARFGKAKAEGAMVASAGEVAIIDELKAIRAQLDVLKEQDEALKGRLITSLGENADTMVDADGTALLTYKLSAGRKAFDTKAFQADHPNLYQKYLKTGEGSRRFLLK